MAGITRRARFYNTVRRSVEVKGEVGPQEFGVSLAMPRVMLSVRAIFFCSFVLSCLTTSPIGRRALMACTDMYKRYCWHRGNKEVTWGSADAISKWPGAHRAMLHPEKLLKN